MAKEVTIARQAGVSSRTMDFQNPRSWGDTGLNRVWNAVSNRAEYLADRATTAEQRMRLERALRSMRSRMRNIAV